MRRPRRRPDHRRRHPRVRDRPPARASARSSPRRSRDADGAHASRVPARLPRSSPASASCWSTTSSPPAARCSRCSRPSRRSAARSSSAPCSSTGAAGARRSPRRRPAGCIRSAPLAARPADLRARCGDLPALRRRRRRLHAPGSTGDRDAESLDRRTRDRVRSPALVLVIVVTAVALRSCSASPGGPIGPPGTDVGRSGSSSTSTTRPERRALASRSGRRMARPSMFDLRQLENGVDVPAGPPRRAPGDRRAGPRLVRTAGRSASRSASRTPDLRPEVARLSWRGRDLPSMRRRLELLVGDDQHERPADDPVAPTTKIHGSVGRPHSFVAATGVQVAGRRRPPAGAAPRRP